MTKDFDGNKIEVGDAVIGIRSGKRYTVVGAWLDSIMVPDRGDRAVALDSKWFRKAPVRHKRWVNIYPDSFACIIPHLTKEVADKIASPLRIACIPIEYEEGEGL